MDYRINDSVSVLQLADLRQSVGWNRMERQLASDKLRDFLTIACYDGSELVGYVASKTKNFNGENCYTVSSLQEALDLAKDSDVFISGGYQLYKEAIDIVDKMYITEIDGVIEGDTFFPKFNEDKFVRAVDKHVKGDIPYTYVTYTRVR